MHAALPAYDGYGGVASSGVHIGSGSVAGLRSSAARRMAVTGRHSPYVNLLVNDVCRPSWRLTLRSANNRAVSTSDMPWSCARVPATMFHTCRKPIAVFTPANTWVFSVCSGVRSPVASDNTEPTRLVSLRSVAYCGLISVGGGAGRT